MLIFGTLFICLFWARSLYAYFGHALYMLILGTRHGRLFSEIGRSYTSVGALTGHHDECDDEHIRERTMSIDDALHDDIVDLVSLKMLYVCVCMYKCVCVCVCDQ